MVKNIKYVRIIKFILIYFKCLYVTDESKITFYVYLIIVLVKSTVKSIFFETVTIQACFEFKLIPYCLKFSAYFYLVLMAFIK